MNRYYFTWYNYVGQDKRTNFILAENIIQAKQIAVLIMQFYGGNRYTVDDIECIYIVNEGYYFTMDEIKDLYKKFNKKFVLPEIKED